LKRVMVRSEALLVGMLMNSRSDAAAAAADRALARRMFSTFATNVLARLDS
ncbi:unnamed protein product, partial [Ostreobium quekettii]